MKVRQPFIQMKLDRLDSTLIIISLEVTSVDV